MKHELKFKSRFRIRTFGRRLGIQSDSGQALVELALILPVALTLLIGIMEIGRYANASIVVSSAARAGVQYAAQNRVTASDTPNIVQAAENDASDFGTLSVTPTHYCTCANGSSSTCQSTDCQGSRIIEYSKVDTQTDLQSLFHYPGLPQSFVIKGDAQMRVSQ